MDAERDLLLRAPETVGGCGDRVSQATVVRGERLRKRVRCPSQLRWFLMACCLPAILLAVPLGGCSDPPNNPPLGPRPTTPPNPGPVAAPDGETPQQAVERLFPIAYRHYLKHARPRRLLEGAKPGPIVPITADYPNAAGPGPPELLALACARRGLGLR